MSTHTEAASGGIERVVLTSEQDHLVDMLRHAFGDWSRQAAAQNLEPAYDAEIWRRLATDLGLLGVDIPEELGGAGFTVVELGLTMMEMGRVLLPSPYLSTVVLGAGALLAAEDEPLQARYLPSIADGSLTVAVAVDESGHGWSAVDVATTATPHENGRWTLDGDKPHVIDGATAGLLVVAARTGAGIGLFAAQADDPGVQTSAVDGLDATRPVAAVRLTAAEAVPMGDPGRGWLALERLRSRMLVATACEQVGAAHACLDMAVEYAKVRRQFGRPIGSFQAIKHLCADLYLEVQAAESAARHALGALATGDDDQDVSAALAAAAAAEALRAAAAANVQIHGGIGFTWEHPAHRYFRRATVSEVFFGSPRSHRLRAFEAIDDGPGAEQ